MIWEKVGQIFNPSRYDDGIKRPWMRFFSQCVSTLVHEDKVRVYFSCRPENDADGMAVSNLTYLDLSRKNLQEIIKVSDGPVIPLGKLGTFDEFAVYPSCVIRYNGEVRLYYAGWTRCRSVPFNTSIGIAISTDNGNSFKRIADGPLMAPDLYEPFVVSGPKVRIFNGKWYMYYLAGSRWIATSGKPEVIYKIRAATSIDGMRWERLNRNIITPCLDENECQAGPDVFLKDGIYHMYFSYRHGLDFRNSKRGYRLGYAYSRDLINWTRDDDKSGIGLSDFGWDSEMMHYPHVFTVDDKWYMFYNGNDFGRYGFGMAVLKHG